MVSSSVDQIYEFSDYHEDDGFRPYGTRLSGGMTWEDVPQALKEAKISLEDQLLHREVRLDPCVFGQLLPNTQNPKVWYALVAVAHLNLDRFGRPITMLRYFWCECEPEDWQGLQAILKWFEGLQQIPLWSREDKLHQNPLEFYQVEKSSINPPRPQTLQGYLLPPNYEQGSDPWKALRQLHSDVLGTVWALKKQNPAGNYPVAWAWNVSDLNNLNGCFIKPVDEVAYHRLKPRVPMMVSNAALPSTSSHQEKLLLSASGHSSPPVGSSVTMSLQQALKAIVENFTRDFEHSPNQEKFQEALQALDQGLKNCRPGQLQQEFQALGYRLLWVDAQKPQGVVLHKLGLLFVWTLLLPQENIDNTPNIKRLLALLTNSPQRQQNQTHFKQFYRAIRKALLPTDLYKSCPCLYLSLLDLTCYFFGELFVAYRQNPNSRETQQLQALFKNLLQEPSWSYYLNTVLMKRIESEELPDAFGSSSPNWQEFEQNLKKDLKNYLEVWKQHSTYYQSLIQQSPTYKQEYENECHQMWPKRVRKLKRSWQWKPILEKSGILDVFKNQQALAWQALFEHLDQGYSTVTGWPANELLPGGITFVRQPSEQNVWNYTQNLITRLTRSAAPSDQRSKLSSLSEIRVAILAGVSIGMLGVIISRLWEPERFPLTQTSAQSVLQHINSTLSFRENPSVNFSSPIVQPSDLASALSQTLGESKPYLLIKADSGSVAIGFSPDKLVQRLEDYQKRMGISPSPLSETADSLLCLTIDQLIRENSSSLVSPNSSKPSYFSKPITPNTLDWEIPVCNDERLFIDRQMYIAKQRFWFGEILKWTEQQAEQADVNNPKMKLIEFLQNFDPNLNDRIQFSPKDPVKQRQLLKAFYKYSLTNRASGSLGISEGLTRPETLKKSVDELRTTEGFFCAFSKAENLNLPACTADESTAESLPTTIPNPVSPSPTPVATTQPEDIYAGVPDDVKSFVDRYSQEWNLNEEEVLKRLKIRLGFGVNEDVSENEWRAKIRLFQREQGLADDGLMTPGGTTESNLELSVFGSNSPPN